MEQCKEGYRIADYPSELQPFVSAWSQMLERLAVFMKKQRQFTGDASHELRTPLTSIREGIGIVLDGLAGEVNAEQKDFLDTAKRNVDRLGRLIDDVLDFTKLRSGKMHLDDSENDIEAILREASKIQCPVVNMMEWLHRRLPRQLKRMIAALQMGALTIMMSIGTVELI